MGLKHKACYLKGTKDKQIILGPDSKILRLDLFADAGFAGLFASEDVHGPVSVRSRTGILINFGELSFY